MRASSVRRFGSMHVGHSCLIGSSTFDPETLAVALEERGFESLWLGEHDHVPVSTRLPAEYGGRRDPAGAPPDPYKRMPDPLVSLAFAAAATRTLRLGTGVALVLEREPFGTAKAVATLDQLSDGRVLFGIGVGWNKQELANHSAVPWRRRYRAAAEFVAALRTLWTQETPAFDGTYIRFDRVWSYPKPHQVGGPPILLGAVGPVGMRHAAEWADGWLPADDRLGDVEAKVREFRRLTADGDRAVGVTLNVRLRRAEDGRWPSSDLLRRYRDLPVERVVLVDDPFDPPDRSERLRLLDAYAAVLPELGG